MLLLQAHEFRDNHDKRDSGRHRDYYRKGDHKDNSGRHENKGAYSQVGRRYPSSFHRKQETATVMETTNRFGGFNDDDEEEQLQTRDVHSLFNTLYWLLALAIFKSLFFCLLLFDSSISYT